MRRPVLIPLSAVVAGLIGLVLRRWELATGFEPETGLAIFPQPASLTLLALSILSAAAFALLCKSTAGKLKADYDRSFRCQSPVYLAVVVVAAVLMLAASVIGLKEFVSRENTVLTRLLLSILLFFGAGSMALAGWNNYRGLEKGKYSFTLLVLPYTCCLWLVVSYQLRAADPVVLGYLYSLLAVISAVLALYHMAGFSFERSKLFRFSFFALLAIYLGIVSLAGEGDLFTCLITLSVILYLLVSVFVLLGNAEEIMEETANEQ